MRHDRPSLVRSRAQPTARARPMSILLVLAVAGLAACADFESPEDPTGGLPDLLIDNPSFVSDIAPVFEARCATGGCHSMATQQGELVLHPQVAYDAIVDVDSRGQPGMPLVAPGDPDDSWLLRMISADPAPRNNLSRMPLASTPLTANQIENIRRWILQGAERN